MFMMMMMMIKKIKKFIFFLNKTGLKQQGVCLSVINSI